jgi:hypothetical protein
VRLGAADPGMLADIGADGRDIPTLVATWPRLVSRTTPERRIAVLAGSRRQRRRLEAVALRAGWLVAGGSADEEDPVVLSRLALSPETTAVLLGADRSPGGDEKRHLPDLAALVAAITRSRPELAIVLAGGAAAFESDFGAFDEPAASAPAAPMVVGRDAQLEASRSGRSNDKEAIPASPRVLLAPDADAGSPSGASLQQVLEGLRALPNDSRLGVARSISSLAYVLDRSIEIVEVGLQGGLLARAEPFGQGHFAVVSSHTGLADGSFAPRNPSEEVIDGVLAWSTAALDRHRAMDRLNDLRLVPWGEADGDGASFRLAAAKAAFGRLIEATPEIADQSMPELLVAAGGIFTSLPPSLVALALADIVRRPGVSHLAMDQARILGPLGAIEDEIERRRLVANLADDILMPLGSLILPAGVRPGRSAGRLRLKDASSTSEIELHPGAVQVIDLPPGRNGRADLEFRDAVRLPKRARHFSIEVGGGLGGLLVDLRDIPMRISDRPDSRRAALEVWQRGMWPEVDE